MKLLLMMNKNDDELLLFKLVKMKKRVQDMVYRTNKEREKRQCMLQQPALSCN